MFNVIFDVEISKRNIYIFKIWSEKGYIFFSLFKIMGYTFYIYMISEKNERFLEKHKRYFDDFPPFQLECFR